MHWLARCANPQRGFRRVFNGRTVAVALLSWLLAFPALAGQASLAWDASAAPATGYYLYHGVAPRTYTSQINVGNQTTYTVPNLTAGQTYFFAVTAYDAAQHESSFSNEASVTIAAPAPTQTALASSANPVIVGATVTFTASVTGSAPTGTVNFLDGGTSITGCAARNLAGSGNTRTATCTTSGLSSGTHSIVASYSGDATNATSTSAMLSQLVEAPSPTFADVPAEYWAFAAIEAVAYNSISLGCASNPRRFCPEDFVARDEMAVFLERATRGIGYPFAPTGVLFADVPITHWAVGPIEQLYADGITLGCRVSPLRFCPDSNVTRAEMAIFLLRARFGPGYHPGSATGLVFADVPGTHWAAAWIEDFAAMGYTIGCRITPHDFCPDGVVTRASMAVFLQRVFNLPGPP